jgi:hypothetical protein
MAEPSSGPREIVQLRLEGCRLTTAALPHWVEADLARAVQVGGRHPDVPAVELQASLYREWYAPATPVEPSESWQPPLFGQYRAAHAGSTTYTTAQVVALAPGGIVLATQDGGRPRALLAGDYCQSSSERQGLPPRVGEQLLIIRRQDAPPAEGWWRTWGGGWRPSDPPAALTRLYLAAEPAHLIGLIGGLTAILQQLATPWLLKAAAERTALGRPDAVVVYLPSAELGDAPESAPVIGALAACATGLLEDARPALTASMCRGVALAEDPADGQSFGERQSALVARALIAARSTGEDPLPVLIAELRAAGMDPVRPHIRPRSQL